MKKFLALALIFTMLTGCSSNAKSESTSSMAYSVPESTEEDMKAEILTDTTGSTDINYSEKIAYFIELNIETKDFDQNIADLTALLDEYDGFIESSSVSGKTRRSAHYSLLVPSENYMSFLENIKETGNVYSQNTFTENLTTQYYDTSSRLNTLEIEETRLLELLEVAENIDDIIALEERLSNIRYEIESLTTTLNVIDFKVDYTSITLYMDEVIDYEETDSFLDNLVATFRNSGTNFVYALENLVFNIIYAAPFLIFWCVILVIIIKVLPVKKLILKIKNNIKNIRKK